MIDDKKIVGIQNREFIEEYLFVRGIADNISDNPRYQSILWKLSNLLMKSKEKAYSAGAKEFLDSVVRMNNDGSIAFIEKAEEDGNLITCKYYVDGNDEKLKRMRTECSRDKKDNCISVSVYDDDGIEESLTTEQIIKNGKYFSKATRVPNRIDMIKLERVKQEKSEFKRLPNIFQIRSFQVGLEDINPTCEEIDPYDIMHFSLLGLPNIYRDLTKEENDIILKMNGKIYPLVEKERERRFKEYKELNKTYSRTNAFENGIAKAFMVKNQDLDK